MTTQHNTSITTQATATANVLWTSCDQVHTLADSIASLMNVSNRDMKVAGDALSTEWVKIGGGHENSRPMRLVIEALLFTDVTRKEASAFANAMQLVSRQRVSQLLGVVYDGDKSKNNGNKPSEGGESQEGLDKGKGFTFEQILASLKSLDKLTMEQAQILASVAASKIA
jgi:hypothetical protein